MMDPQIFADIYGRLAVVVPLLVGCVLLTLGYASWRAMK